MVYRIKALEWEDYERSSRAKTAFGPYEVLDCIGTYFISISPGKTSSSDDEFETIEQAKSACQEHWESMLKQGLEEV